MSDLHADLAECLWLVDRATPGEWRPAHKGVLKDELVGTEVYGVMSPGKVCPCITGPMTKPDSERDAKAIAAAINLLRTHRDELLGVVEDAARYRFLRDQRWESSNIFVIKGGKEQVRLGTHCPNLGELDAAIDAARHGRIPADGGHHEA